MKLSKYAVAFLLLLLTVAFNVVLSDGFLHAPLPDAYTFYLDDPEQADPVQMDAVAREHGLLLFTLTREEVSLHKTNFTYYTAADHTDTLWNAQLGLKPGVVKNLIGDVHVVCAATFDPLMQDINLRMSANTWFLLGDEADCRVMLRVLEDDYDCTVNRVPPELDPVMALPYVMFAFVLVLLLLYCYIDASFSKKEIAIRAMHGDSPLQHYVKASLLDTVVFTGMFAFLLVVQFRYTQLLAHFARVYWLFLPFVFGIWLVNLHLLQIRPKEMLYGHRISERLLAMLSGLGWVTAVVSCAVIVFMLSLIPSVEKYRKAEAFFATRQDYYFMELQTPPQEMERILSDQNAVALAREERRAFDRATDAVFENICIADLTDMLWSEQSATMTTRSRQDVTYNPIYCNHRALPYLQSVFSEAADVDLTRNDAALLLPESLSTAERQEITQFFLGWIQSAEGYTPSQTRIQLCSFVPAAEVLCFGTLENKRFMYYDCPAICVVSDTFARADIDALHVNHDFLDAGVIYRIADPSALDPIFADYSFSPMITNVYEKFQIDYQVQKSLILLCAVIIFMMVLLCVSVLRTVLQLDYQVNAVEIAIQKTLGYGTFHKNRKHFIGAATVGVLNLIGAVVYAQTTGTLPLAVAIVAPLVLFGLHCVLLCFLIQKIEKQKIVKILKGGAL